MITICTERLHECLEELKPLLEQQYRELAIDQDKVALNPKYEKYLELEDAGHVLALIARHQGRVQAYFVGFIDTQLHFKDCTALQMDIFWLHPEYRSGDSLKRISGEMLALDLFDAVKREALQRGVQRVYYGSKFHKDASALFEYLGLREVERYYSAWWGE